MVFEISLYFRFVLLAHPVLSSWPAFLEKSMEFTLEEAANVNGCIHFCIGLINPHKKGYLPKFHCA